MTAATQSRITLTTVYGTVVFAGGGESWRVEQIVWTDDARVWNRARAAERLLAGFRTNGWPPAFYLALSRRLRSSFLT